MSCDEWERGEWTLPKKEWAKFKKAVRAAWTSYMQMGYERAMAIHKKITGQGIKKNVRRAIEEGAYGLDEYMQWEVVRALTGPKEKVYLPRKQQFPKANAKTMRFDMGECVLVLQEPRRVRWHVGENNHARDRAHEIPFVNAFLRLINEVKWVRGTGGQIVGNDEYNRDNAYEGGGANYVIARHGLTAAR
jgi:hypothetical protein